MPDEYTENLYKICELPKTELFQLNYIDDSRRQWIRNLLKAVSPRPTGDRYEDWPRFIPAAPRNEKDPARAIRDRGGEALIIEAYDKKRGYNIIFKFAKPLKERKAEKQALRKHRKLEPPQSTQSEKKKEGTQYLQGVRELCTIINPVKRAEIKRERKEAKFRQRATDRFRRGYTMHDRSYRRMNKREVRCGYIPRPFECSDPPQLYYTMEIVNGEDVISWCKCHEDYERVYFFYQCVVFTERVFHDGATIHTDIAINNMLVYNNKPVFFDFGLAKNLQDKSGEVTTVEDKLGKDFYASPEQLDRSKERKYQSDIFMLGRLFWIIWNQDIPDYTSLTVEYDSDGDEVYDSEEIAKLFTPEIFGEHVGLEYVFKKSVHPSLEERYKDISYLRRDVEKVLRQMDRRKIGNQDELQEIKERVSKIENKLARLAELLEETT